MRLQLSIKPNFRLELHRTQLGYIDKYLTVKYSNDGTIAEHHYYEYRYLAEKKFDSLNEKEI